MFTKTTSNMHWPQFLNQSPRSLGPELSSVSIFLPSSLPQANYSQIMPVLQEAWFPNVVCDLFILQKANLEASHFKDSSPGLLYKANQKLFSVFINSSPQLPLQWVLFKVLTISIKLPSWHPFPPPPRNAWKGIQLWADVRSFLKAFCVK